MFEIQKHLVKLQQNKSFSPATFNSKKIKIWPCNTSRKLPSRIFFSLSSVQEVFKFRSKKSPLAEPLLSQSCLVLLWDNGQEESEVGNGKSRTPCRMNPALRRMCFLGVKTVTSNESADACQKHRNGNINLFLFLMLEPL